jgi:hypothetical protein
LRLGTVTSASKQIKGSTMKVYVVIYAYHEDVDIIKVFARKEDAEALEATNDHYYVEEYEVHEQI